MVEVDEDGEDGWGHLKKAENRIGGGSSIGFDRGGEERERSRRGGSGVMCKARGRGLV